MCGRYASTKNPATLAAEFDAVDATEDAIKGPDYNVAPTRNVVAVVQRHPRTEDGEPDMSTTERTLRVMKWGLVPAWAKDPKGGAKMINARSESAAEKPAFRTSWTKRRCLMPADGWYEWQRDGKVKQPYFTTRKDGASLAMAGLWTVWRDKQQPDSPPLVTCSVLTMPAVDQLAEIHDRMPVLMPPDRWAAWLDPDNTDPSGLIAPPSEDFLAALELRPVSPAVNSIKNNGPELMAPAVEQDEPALFDLGR
ncbi:SOS response-associated peptidase [Kibdelosporangium persicum]|uniref:Abasic site processing protein n=1 Tax=Kibdelosporangium persicum TaxID=2698649 RepID=A0ABX2F0K6_9PSEU|nr:SOS response-associated peptidase [Kibdelosporangium persicum]NRN64834.1 SOS response-associated peptidase [Kibdelosporangium persicum]